MVDELTVLGEAFGELLTAERQAIYARALSDIPKDQLHRAILAAVKELKWFPKVAELRELAGVSYGIAVDGRPGPEEAWARMPKGERIEDDTVIWCEEERAAYDACRSLLLNGDLIGARMAFKERYERELAEARSEGKRVCWSISAGYDMEQRLSALASAVQDKRISLKGALDFIPGDRQSDFAHMLPAGQAKGLLRGHAEVLPELPGLPGILARMRMEGTVPEDLKPSTPSRPSPPLTEGELQKRRQELRAQKEFIEHSRNGTSSGTTQSYSGSSRSSPAKITSS